MSFRIWEGCDGCGTCALACPRGAIRRNGGPFEFTVSGDECNDCRTCSIVCPEFAVSRDPEWAVCWGRGCPLTSRRYEGWACAEGLRRCARCGSTLWKPPGARVWACARCDLETKVMCPKARKAGATAERDLVADCR